MPFTAQQFCVRLRRKILAAKRVTHAPLNWLLGSLCVASNFFARTLFFVKKKVLAD